MKDEWTKIIKSQDEDKLNKKVNVSIELITYADKQKGLQFVFEWDGKVYSIYDNIKNVYSKSKQLGIKDSNIIFKFNR